MDEKFWYLKNCDLFERLSRDEVKGLEARSQSRKYPRSSLIYLPADASDSVFLLATGRVKIYHLTAEGKQGVLAIIDPGELFGELAVFAAQSREEYAETMESSVIVRIPREEVARLIEKHPNVSFEITKLMGLRRQRSDRRLKSLLFRSNRDRLICLLLELVEKYGRATPQGVRLDIKLSHQDLATHHRQHPRNCDRGFRRIGGPGAPETDTQANFSHRYRAAGVQRFGRNAASAGKAASYKNRAPATAVSPGNLNFL